MQGVESHRNENCNRLGVTAENRDGKKCFCMGVYDCVCAREGVEVAERKMKNTFFLLTDRSEF